MPRVFRFGSGRGHITREVEDELAFHIEMRTQKLIAAGLSPDAARLEALRQFGDVGAVRQFCITADEERERAMRRANLLDELRQDLVYAARVLRRNAVFTAVIVVTLALGIGANTAIFTLIDAVLLRKLPVPAPDELIAIGDPSWVQARSQDTGPGVRLMSYPLYKDLRERNQLVSGLLASGRVDRLDVLFESGGGQPEHPRGRFVSGNYFAVLRVPPLRGRTFTDADDRVAGASPVVVISHGFWTGRLAADPRVIGRDILMNGARFTIIGVTPSWFTGEIVGQTNDIWIPLTMQPTVMPNRPFLADPTTKWLLLLGRLTPGVTFAQARVGFTSLLRQTSAEHLTEPGSGAGIATMPVFVSSGAKGLSRVRATFAKPLITLMVGVALLLVIICANVANLLLARAVVRAREMSVRLAIGARRARLVRQLLTESLVLALLGAGGGLLVARVGSRLLIALAGDGAAAVPLDTRLDLPVLVFAMGLSVVAVLLFGLVPSLRASRIDLAATMRAGATGIRGGALSARGRGVPVARLLIAGQVALSLVLLIGAGLLVRSLRHLQNADTGLDRDHLLIVDVDAPTRGYRGDRLTTLVRDLSDRLARVPGVAALTFSTNGIFSGTEGETTLQVAGFVARSPDDSLASYDEVGGNYARAIGARVIAGRDITPTDDGQSARIALVNETMARFYFAGGSPLGRSLRINDTLSLQIVGVIADTKDHDLGTPPVRRFYASYLQRSLGEPAALRFELRAVGDPSALIAPVRAVLSAVDPQFSANGVRPLTTLMRQSITQERLLARLATGFGALALLLAAVGLYGVMTYAIARRTSEIGLRVALGAQASDVMELVITDALRIVGIGVVAGVPLAVGASQLLRNQLHGIGTADPVAIGVALLVLGMSALLAALVPAVRAARVAPLVALRQE
jgi:predicted permease